jgi:hypothetical protein
MTRNEALIALDRKTPVIYTGAGSLGRAVRSGAVVFRGSPQSIRSTKRSHLWATRNHYRGGNADGG